MMEDEQKQVNSDVLFDGFTISDLYKKIYLNHYDKEKKISSFLEEIKMLIVETADAALLGPLIKDLTDLTVKNDDHLIKLATAAIRLIQSGNKSTDKFNEDGFIPISPSEKNELLNKLNEISLDIDNN